MINPTPESPTAPERLPALDLIRGIAVLAILLANIPMFSQPLNTSGGRAGDDSWTDIAVNALTLMFVDGKFITLFSILFGAGLTLQLDRAVAEGRPFVGYYLRRQGLLLLIGLAHGLFLWWGDILAAYALVGMIAVFLLRQKPLGVWLTMGAFFAFAYAMLLVATVGCALLLLIPTDGSSGEIAEMAARAEQDIDPASLPGRILYFFLPENEIRVYQGGLFGEMLLHRIVMLAGSLSNVFMITGWYLMGCFLLGGVLTRHRVLHEPDAHRALTRRLIVVGLCVGVPIHLAALAVFLMSGTSMPFGIDVYGALSYLFNGWGALALALAYLGLFLRWSVSGWFEGLQFLLRSVGRMALTNYLMQSVVCGLVFYGYGFGYFGLMNRAQALLIVLGIWLLQLGWSPLWLHFFTMGPVEWVWRCLSDGKWRPLLRRAGDQHEVL